MTFVLFTLSFLCFVLAAASQHLADVRARESANVLRTRAEDRERILERVMGSTHHELSRELMLLAFEIDDLRDDGVEVDELYDSLHRLEAGRDQIAVLAQLGGSVQRLYRRSVWAEELVPRLDLHIETKTVSPILADPALVRAAIYSGVVHLQRRYGVSQLWIEARGDRLVLEITGGTVAPSAVLPVDADEEDPADFGRRIVAAHGGSLEIEEIPSGWRFIGHFPEDLAESSADEIDVRRDFEAAHSPAFSEAPPIV